MSKFLFCAFLSLFLNIAFSTISRAYGPEISLMNIDKVWNQGITGKNVIVAVVDDAVDFRHSDLRRNYERFYSYDFIGDDWWPLPGVGHKAHGTKCAGVIASRYHGTCRTGVSYDAKLAAISLVTGQSVDDFRTAKGLRYKTDNIDIYSNSWGPADNGYTIKNLAAVETRALSEGANKGRSGLGSIYVFAAGNGGLFGDSCAFDGYVNDINTIAIGPFSKNGGVPRYSEPCSSVMAASYGDYVKTCTGSYSECVTDFGKTSGATAFASGIIALALQANDRLTQRDIQHLIVRTSNPRQANIKESEWSVNGAGLIFHPVAGFGVMDAKKIVDVARTFSTSVPRQRKCSTGLNNLPKRIYRRGSSYRFSFDYEYNCPRIKAIEHLKVEVSLNYSPRGIMEMYITSPQGTKSQLLYARRFDSIGSAADYKGLVVTSLHFWGENPSGEWTVLFKASDSMGSSGRTYGTLKDFKVSLYGTEDDPLSSSTLLPTGKIRCGGTNRIWRGYGSGCCGSLWTYDSRNEICCRGTNEIVPRNSRCGRTTYNKCGKMCCDGVLFNKIQNNVAMSCCGREAYDSSKEICCGGRIHAKSICKEDYWQGYYLEETRCSSDGTVRTVYTGKPCEGTTISEKECEDKQDLCYSWYDCTPDQTLSYKKENCAKTCGLC